MSAVVYRDNVDKHVPDQMPYCLSFGLKNWAVFNVHYPDRQKNVLPLFLDYFILFFQIVTVVLSDFTILNVISQLDPPLNVTEWNYSQIWADINTLLYEINKCFCC